jgi:hexosaminidase
MIDRSATRCRRAISHVVLGTLVLLAGSSPVLAAPITVPALREWSAGSRAYTFSSASRVVVDSAFATDLTAVGDLFAAELRVLSGYVVPRVSGASGGPSDIFLTLGSPDSALGTEGYTMGSSPG